MCVCENTDFSLKATAGYYIQTPVHAHFTLLFRTDLLTSPDLHQRLQKRYVHAAICKHGLDSFCVDAGANVVTGQLKDDMHEGKMLLANSYGYK